MDTSVRVPMAEPSVTTPERDRLLATKLHVPRPASRSAAAVWW
jgi:hypothetical protein